MTIDQDKPEGDKVIVRLASTPQEVAEAQSLRYKVFYEEYHAIADAETARLKMDIDEYDAVTDHLIVLDEHLPRGQQIVGTYRLLRRDVAEKYGKFYTSGEFNIDPLLKTGTMLLELGRSCVLPPYRTRPVLQKLWEGIAQYVGDHDIGIMFGCGSFPGTDVEAIAHQLSFLYHYHLAAPELCPKALDHRYVEMNMIPIDQINAKTTFMSLPPLIKGYIRLGASIGNGAVIDHQWNSTDVCIVMPTHLITDKYLKHYQRKTNNSIKIDGSFAAVKETA